MIDNSLAKLLEKIEPKVQDIEDNRVELKALRNVQRTMNELMENAKNSYQEIINFYDQDFIIKAIKIGNSNYHELISKYNSSKYLLQTNDDNLKELPQYQEALGFMDYLYQYLHGLNDSINFDYKNKKDNLEIQELLNKYYILLKKENIFIRDISDFITFMELSDIEIQDKINIYKEIINFNLKQYLKSPNIELDGGLEIEDIEKLLDENQKLLNENYDENDAIKVRLEDYLKITNKIDENVIENRKIFLIHKIKEYNDLKQYVELVDYYKEFTKIQKLQMEFAKQKQMPRKLLFTYENDVSLVRKYINNALDKYKKCILKNLLDIENNTNITIPKKKFDDIYIYLKDEYVVKTVYTFLDNGKVLILGVLDENDKLNNFLERNAMLIKNTVSNRKTIDLADDERNLLLNNVKLEDLMLNIALETLDIKREDYNAR